MAEPRRIPREFIDWLKATYSRFQVMAWLQDNASYGKWQTDEYYLHWKNNVDNVSTGGTVTVRELNPEYQAWEQAQAGQKIPPKVLEGLENGDYLDRFKKATTVHEIEAIVNEAFAEGVIPSESLMYLVYDTYAPQVLPIDYLRAGGMPEENIKYLTDYSDKDDLSTRIQFLKQLGALPGTLDASEFYSSILEKKTDYEEALKAAEKQKRAGEAKQLAYEEKERQRQEQIAAPYRAQALSDVANSPYITNEDRAKYRDLPVDQYTAVMRSIADERAKAAGGMTQVDERLAKTKDMRMSGREYGQAGQAFLNAFNNPPSMQREGTTPPLPSFMPVVDEFRKGIGYGEGTRLRSFLESELPEAVSGAQGARQAWWKRMNPPESTSYEDTLSGMKSREAHYQSLAEGSPTGSVVGGVYYGEGGPAAMAQRALEDVQARIAGLSPDQFDRSRPVKEEDDPLKGILEKLKVGSSARYYRQPGTGINPRLAPSVRFR